MIETIYEKDGETKTPPNKYYSTELDESCKGRAIAVSPDGRTILVGTKDGTVKAYDNHFKKVKQFKQAKREISDIKFSPDGTLVYAGAHDRKIYGYNFTNWTKRYRPFDKHSSYITHIDFS